MSEIKSLSIRHEAIMDYLMANPVVKLGDVAVQFGVTPAWLSQIIHSDAFQSLLQMKQGIAFHSTVLPLREKMVAVAHQALDSLVERLPMETENKTLADVAEGMLERLGFSSKQPPAGPLVNLQVNVMREEIENAQRLLGKAEKPVLGVIIDGERAPIAIRPTSQTELGAPRISAPVFNPEALWPKTEAGTEV